MHPLGCGDGSRGTKRVGSRRRKKDLIANFFAKNWGACKHRRLGGRSPPHARITRDRWQAAMTSLSCVTDGRVGDGRKHRAGAACSWHFFLSRWGRGREMRDDASRVVAFLRHRAWRRPPASGGTLPRAVLQGLSFQKESHLFSTSSLTFSAPYQPPPPG